MTTISSFIVGGTYTNDQIRFALDVENLGGIRPSLDADRNIRHVAVLTTSEESGKLSRENPYQDRIEGDVLTYTAQGREGDQDLKGRNKRLLEQYNIPTPLFGFVNMGRQTYRFLGLLELLRHYQEPQEDRNGNIRRVWLFEFRIHSVPEFVPIAEAKTITSMLLAQTRQDNPMASLDREVDRRSGSDPSVKLIPTQEVEHVRLLLLQIPPFDFERFIKEIMERSGFVNVSVTKVSGDGGIDLNAYVEEANSFFAGTHVQAQVKRWRHAVGSPEINSFRGALSSTAKGVFVTTSAFTKAAVAEANHANKPSISLIDGPRLSGIVTSLNLFPG